MKRSTTAPRAPAAARGGLAPLPLALAALLLAALAALVLPAAVAWADGGSVSLGVRAGSQVEAPAPGDAGSVGIGVEAGVAKATDESTSGESGGTVAIGAEVGYAGALAAEHAVAFDAGLGAFSGGGSVLERVLADGARAQRPETDPERPGWLFLGWFQEGEPDSNWDAGGASKVPLGDEWDFTRRVTDDTRLHAKWLRAAGSGSVSLGVEVADRVEAPKPGNAGSVLVGAEVGLKKEEPGGSAGESGGTVPIGAEVGYALASQREARVTFDAGEGSFADGSSTSKVTVPLGTAVSGPEDPRRPGWRFVAWHAEGEPQEGFDPTGASGVPLGEAWDFSRGVSSTMTLHAKWELRLDVTVPVSVGFAVDASTGEAMGPDSGAYAIKSRTARPVRVERLDLEARDSELDEFFALANDDEGDRPLEGAGADDLADWRDALSCTVLSLASENASTPIGLPFAGEHEQLEDKDGAAYWAWTGGKPIENDRAAWALPTSDRGIADPDAVWDGKDADQMLRIAFGLDVSDGLRVKTGQQGAVPIAHLKVTVSAAQ